MPLTKYTTAEVGERGEAMYQRDIRPKVEADNFGRYLVLDIESGEYEIDDRHLDASHRAHEKHPDGVFYVVRIGLPATWKGGSLKLLTR